jgi:glycine C-acetyltransferase
LIKADPISGTLSRALGRIGGLGMANPKLINFIKYKPRRQVFSSSPPAAAGLLKTIDLIDEETRMAAGARR